MYNQQIKPKVLVRPRSNILSDDPRHKPVNKKKPSSTILSLVTLCIFLIIICVCLVSALVFIGKSLSNDQKNKKDAIKIDNFCENQNTTSNNEIFLLNSTKSEIQENHPKVIFRLNQQQNQQTLKDTNMTLSSVTSKIIKHLSFRLPRQIRPIYYDLLLQPNLNESTFNGNVSIRLKILEPISYIPIHSKKLNITETSFYKILDDGETNAPINILQTFEYEPHEYWVTEFDNNLDIGEYSLNLSFNGSLINRIVGFYQSSYLDTKTGKKRFIASSKFEPTYARQAFPCFDEPAMKAKFKVTIVRPTKDYIALSNMNQMEEKEVGNVTHVQFQESVEMSTYLACFIVCDFQYESQKINTLGIGEPFDMRVYATAEQINKTKFALDTGVKVTEYYIQYFKIPYPLPKLDMIAIPDFVSGAMEHWGLVTFRETAFLYNELISSTVNKQRAGVTVAHELAHMWFGNLVTMKWWDDLWLNEGFATYLSFKGLNHVYPSWKLMDQFIIEEVHGVMNLDATTASHPIVQKVENPDQITELFDTITYQKGASIIRMLEDFVGPEIFQNAVTNYLEKFKYSNAITDDLLTKIGELETTIDVKYIMQTWTEQMGLPVVNVQKINDTSYKLTQKRFFSNPEDEKQETNDSPFNYKWYIPITYIKEGNSEEVKRTWFNNQDTEVVINLDNPANWIKLNKDQIGYYRVNYPKEIWEKLLEVLKTESQILSTSDRAHLLNDAFALADASQLDYDIALNLTTYLENETEYVPWSVTLSKFLYLQSILRYTNIYKEFINYSRELVNKPYKNAGWIVDEDHMKNRLRTVILELACSVEHPECMKEAAAKFQEFLKNTNKRPTPDLRSIIYYYGMIAVGNEEIWNEIWELFLKEQDANEKLKLMRSLSGIQIPWILSRFIDLAWDENNVRGQDYFTCMAYIAENPIGENLVWNYVRDNWQKLVNRFGLNERYLGRMIPSITSRFSTKTRLKEMESFFNEYPNAGAGTAARKQALQKVKINIKWIETNKEKVENWLKKT